jgi:hypothetical protein
VRAQLEQRVIGALVETESALSEQVVRASAAAVVETEQRLGEIAARARDLAARRSGKLAACERDLAAVRAWLATLERPDSDIAETAESCPSPDGGRR